MSTSPTEIKEIRNLKLAVKALVEAELENQWKGAGRPEDIPLVEANLRLRKAAYKRAIVALQNAFYGL